MIHTLLSMNAQWPGYRSTNAAPWAERASAFAKEVRANHVDVIAAQEMGFAEARVFGQKLGNNWSYQRSGLNCVFWWRPEWSFLGVHDWTLPGYGSEAKTFITCNLSENKTNAKCWVGSTHLQSTGGGEITVQTKDSLQIQQAGRILERVGSWRRLIIGADLNEKDKEVNGARDLLQRGGFTFDCDAVSDLKSQADAGKGIDAVFWLDKIKVHDVRILPFGDLSDHDGRLAEFEVL